MIRLTIHDLSRSHYGAEFDGDAEIGIMREEMTGGLVKSASIVYTRSYLLRCAAEENGGAYADLWRSVCAADYAAKHGDHGYGPPDWRARMREWGMPISFEVQHDESA